MSSEPRPRREFLERWFVLNTAYALAFWLSISFLAESPHITAFIREDLGAFIARAVFLHAVPLNVMYLLASAHCYFPTLRRWHEHRVFFLLLLIAGVLWAVFLPSEIVSQ